MSSNALAPLAILSRQHRLRNCPWQMGEDRLQASDYGFEQADAAPQRPINIRFDRALVMQIDDSNRIVPLTEAIDTADALLHPHRVPRHIVVNQGAAELEVQTGVGLVWQT